MAAPTKRIDGIDFWRGLALLMIFIDHVPENVFQHVTQKNFGFSDAAELFVFLSGVSVALAYGTRFFNGETVGAVRALLRRAFTLYWVQILISLLIVGIFTGAAALWKEDDLLEDADVVVSNPLQTTAAILALLHQLENANILPLYIALLLMTPLLLALARRDDRLMLAASAGIYLAARAFSLNLPTWPVEGTWWFNPIAWQLIFAIGIFAGRRLKGGGIAYDARLFSACLAIVVIGALVRTDAFGYASGLWQDVCNVLDCGKTDLGFARLVHFLALAYIVYHSGVTGLMRRTPAFPPLCLIGRYGLPVFATGTVLSAMGELVETRSEALSHHLAFGAAIVVGGILIHYLVARGLAACRNPRQVGDGGVLVHIRVRSICAGIAALALGVSLESVGRHLVGATSAELRPESALFSVFETIRPKSLDHRASLVRVASLETGFAFESAVEESEPPASTSRHDSFGERFLFDQKLASFDERFSGADISVVEAEEGASNVLNYARLPSPGPGEHAIAQPATGQSAPKLAPAASSQPASAARKRVATAEASKDSISPVDNDSRTAIYDIAARTVYLPNGRRLEAHSGLGSYMDDARYVNFKRQGPTPPNTYKLVMREEPFHGVRAIRLVPVGDGKMFGRDGLLAHSYMLGPNGQSNGCVSFSDYPAFLDAYLKGEVDRLVVVEQLATAPGPKTASGWLPEFIKDLFRRS